MAPGEIMNLVLSLLSSLGLLQVIQVAAVMMAAIAIYRYFADRS